MLELWLPLEQIKITQPFGVQYLDFYKKLRLKGHNGIDFAAGMGCPVYCSLAGQVSFAGTDGDGGVAVEIINLRKGFKTIYYHLKEPKVKVGDWVSESILIALADNTGKMTTGSHLHLTLKQIEASGETLDGDNGYHGAIDPAPYFKYAFNGRLIKNKDWDKSRAYHRYWQSSVLRQPWRNEWGAAVKLWGALKFKPSPVHINAYLYGKWEIEDIKNPALYDLYSQLTKTEFKNKKKLYG